MYVIWFIKNEIFLKALRTSKHYCVGGFKGSLDWAPIMPRDASVLHCGGAFSQSGPNTNFLQTSVYGKLPQCFTCFSVTFD